MTQMAAVSQNKRGCHCGVNLPDCPCFVARHEQEGIFVWPDLHTKGFSHGLRSQEGNRLK